MQFICILNDKSIVYLQDKLHCRALALTEYVTDLYKYLGQI